MSTIISGRFQLPNVAEQAVTDLALAGFPLGASATQFVNLSVEHELHPRGDDRDRSPGSARATAASSTDPDADPDAEPVTAKSGVLVAVTAGDPDEEGQAINILSAYGAADIERAEGRSAGDAWTDFSPLAPVRPLPDSLR
jgi:hypothetical protein